MANPNERFVKPETFGCGDLLKRPTLEEVVQYASPARQQGKTQQMAVHLSEIGFMPLPEVDKEVTDFVRRRMNAAVDSFASFEAMYVADFPQSDPEWATYGGLNRDTPDRGLSFYRNAMPERPQARTSVDVCVLTPEEEAAVEPSREKLQRYALQVETLADDLTGQLAIEAEDYFGYSLLRTKLKMAPPLTRCLASLGIEPLHTDAVEQYKKEMMVFHRAEMKRNKTWTAVSRMSWVDLSIFNCSEAGIEIPEFALSRCVQIAKAMKDQNASVDFTVQKLMDVDPFMYVESGDEMFYIDCWLESKFEATL